MKSSNSVMLCLCATLALGLATPSLGFAAAPGAAAYQRSYEHEVARRFRAAIKSLDAVPSGKRGGYFHQLRLGWLRYLAADHRPAIAAYRRATAAAPRALEPWLGRMLPQMALRLWKDAEASARRALRMDSKNFLASSRLAWCLYNLGRYSEAERVYGRVLALYPANIAMRAGFGWSLLKQGKKAPALKAFNEVLAVSPKHLSAQEGARAAGR